MEGTCYGHFIIVGRNNLGEEYILQQEMTCVKSYFLVHIYCITNNLPTYVALENFHDLLLIDSKVLFLEIYSIENKLDFVDAKTSLDFGFSLCSLVLHDYV